MSLDALVTKRVRRTWEPEEKAWHDEALQMPWEDITPSLHKATVFSLKNVFFFSHATPVQAATVAKIGSPRQSAIVEAPTGSGKTLAFLIPLMERTIRACEAFVLSHSRPPLTRDIIGVIISPSRILAEQTFVVARNLAARYPYNVQFALCDGVLEKPAAVVKRLTHGARGAGTFIVSTPKDFDEFLLLLKEANAQAGSVSTHISELLAEQDEETRRRYLAKQRRLAREANPKSCSVGVTDSQSESRSDFFSSDERPFTVVVDEADLVFNSPEMKLAVSGFIDSKLSKTQKPPTAAKGKKRSRSAATSTEVKNSGSESLKMDFFFVGATVATSDFVAKYAKEVCSHAGTQLNVITSRSTEDFITQLQNRYVACDAHNFLPVLTQMMNVHASKKHFVFFNNYRALQFVRKLFGHLCQGERPLLFIKNIYVMYEGMPENARMEQYNKFLTHRTSTAETARKPKKALSEAEKKNTVFTGGWKRDGKVSMGSGAILLCTDIAAFGLDVRDVDYVYHFEPPSTVQSYIHRVGRVGRMGMKGNSILLLPCMADTETMVAVRERKTTSSRFNTVTNTKNTTGELQSQRISVDSLSEERRAYVEELAKCSALEEYTIPPFAPITPMLRNVIAEDKQLVKLAKAAAISMCVGNAGDSNGVTDGEPWFTPKLALQCLLLD